jgi:hypothetical protein
MKTPLVLTALALLSACSSPGTAPAAAASTGSVKPYPLQTCIVTGNALGSMGDEQRIVHEGREIKFCCKPCVGKFQKNPVKYLAKLP